MPFGSRLSCYLGDKITLFFFLFFHESIGSGSKIIPSTSQNKYFSWIHPNASYVFTLSTQFFWSGLVHLWTSTHPLLLEIKTWNNDTPPLSCCGQIPCHLAIQNLIPSISMHIPSLVKIHWHLLKLSSRNKKTVSALQTGMYLEKKKKTKIACQTV